MKCNFCNITNKYLCKCENTKRSIKNNAIEFKYKKIEIINVNLFLESVEFFVNNIIKKHNFDNVKHQLKLLVELKK